MFSSQRKYWGNQNIPLPKLDLTAVQKESYQDFLTNGIAHYLQELNPIEDFSGKNWQLVFDSHYFESPPLTPLEAIKKNLTYSMPLRVKVTLTNKKTGHTTTQDVFLGNIPTMTERGTFIINGVERVIINQIVRSPGVFFFQETDKLSGQTLHRAELRPMRGSWLEFIVSKSDLLYVKIDRHRKFLATTLLKALGFTDDEEILALFQDVDTDKKHQYIFTTLAKDTNKTKEDALLDIYDKLRPGEPLVLENALNLFYQTFFDHRYYDLSDVGRYKLNKKLSLNIPNKPANHVLQKQDVIATLKYLINLQNGLGKVDDIDHLANRRVRRVGELVGVTAFRVGLLRLERSIREKMSLLKSQDLVTPASLINARPIIAVISEFFRRNRLSAILDQTNPLSEIDNLRRLSVMGTGGITRERASFSMRDINQSQYSRICPIRSPEGQNIGLVTYLSLYTRVNKYGFLEAPYRRVVAEKKNNKILMKVTDEVIYLSPDDEEEYYITHAGIQVDDQGYIQEEWLPARYQGKFIEVPVEKIQFIDVVPRQVVGTSASLIPFIAHDEANRALMGSHMQCQAVPLIRPQAPVIGTGMESAVVTAMGRTVKALHPGTVEYVDSQKIVIKVDSRYQAKAQRYHATNPHELIFYQKGREIYNLLKFYKTSQSTCYNQKPIVKVGDKIQKGQVIIDGPASDHGELALGQNLVIAYASFEGLGYEDAIIISDRLVKEDLLTSIHINEYETQVMTTKLGPEELTRDIPNVSEADLRNLGEDGIVVVGAEVNPHDILVGKIAPKGETELSAEEKLLRAIFGEKAREVRDSSLRMPNGESGTVVDVQVLDREQGDELDPGVIKVVKIKVAQMRKIKVGDKLAGRHGNKGVISKILPAVDMPHLADGTPVDIIISPLSVLARMNLGQLLEATLGWAASKLGYTVAVPVFEAVSEDKINDQLRKAGLPVSGKVYLYDGRTGERFDQPTTVGIGYILKLIHMVDDKVHARSTGPYSLVTQQPLGGKAQMGGQRLGEMEVWALEAHRAAHTLQEMLTIKSDDIVGRAKAFEAIVKGLDIPEPKVPESFKVLIHELNALGLQIDPIDSEEKLHIDTPLESEGSQPPSQDDSSSDQTQDEALSSTNQETDNKGDK